MVFRNAYEDAKRAVAYDQLELSGTYHLAFRDLPILLERHVSGTRAVDFGCGTGRTARFLKTLGFDVVGVDIATEMVAIARRRDKAGDYRVVEDGRLDGLPRGTFDLVLAAFVFDNVPTADKKVRLFRGLGSLIASDGRIVSIVSTPEMYTHEWVTFSTKDYPENRSARSGDVVRIVTLDYSDRRPVEDILFSDEDYHGVYARAGLELMAVHRPIARRDDSFPWVNEATIAPWAIYVLGRRPV